MITGPTAGIGKSIAYQLAERGENLLLVARREDRLKSISDELESKFNVKVNYFVADLTLQQAPKEIYLKALTDGFKLRERVNSLVLLD